MDWRTQLKADPADWLLASQNPSIRYFTYKDVLDVDPGNPVLAKGNLSSLQVTGYVPAPARSNG
jgi:hypothetical protein